MSAEHADTRRRIFESDWYRRLFLGTHKAERGSSGSIFRTSAGGTIRSVSVGGPVTGRGAEVIILDDCMKADARHSEAARLEVINWYSTTLTQRINDKRAGLVISIQQRICEDDLPAYLLERNLKYLSLIAGQWSMSRAWSMRLWPMATN